MLGRPPDISHHTSNRTGDQEVLEATEEQPSQTAKEIIPQVLREEAAKLQNQAKRLQSAVDSSFQSIENSVRGECGNEGYHTEG